MEALSPWLAAFSDEREKARVLEIGQITGLKSDYQPANFERALLLRHILRTRRPKAILELGSGRGLGSLAMADVLAGEGLEAEITTVDILPPETKQPWALVLDGQPSTENRALRDVWANCFPQLRQRVTLRTGATTEVLPALLNEGRQYDFIFIDAGHDVFSVFHDFSYCTLLLKAEGVMLMDDFAPLEAFGLGTCIVAAHAEKFFGHVEVVTSDGVVFHPEQSGFRRGMVYLGEKTGTKLELSSPRLLATRVLGKAMEGLFSPAAFPLQQA